MLKTDHVNVEMLKKFAPRPGARDLLPEISPKAQVALMCRILFAEGWDDHIAGHITVRQPDGTILTNPWELTWDEVTADDIVTIDAEGNVLDSDWPRGRGAMLRPTSRFSSILSSRWTRASPTGAPTTIFSARM